MTVHEPLEYMNLNLDEIAANLGSSVPGATPPISINSAAFTFIAPRAELESIVASYGKLSLKFKKGAIVDSDDIRTALNTKSLGQTVNAVEAKLREWIRLRNRLAHSQGEVRDIDVATIELQHKVLKAFATRIDAIASK